MKKFLFNIGVIALTFSFASLSHAAVKCQPQKTAFDRATSDYTRTDAQLQRLQQQMDSKSEQADYRRSTLEGNVEQARANVKAAETGAIGQGLGCLLAPRPNCVGPTVNQVMQKIARAKAALKAAEGRLNAFNKATDTQMTRFSQRITTQQQLVATKKQAMDQREVAYNTCMGA